MKIIVCDTITRSFERNKGESKEEFLEYYYDLDHLLSSARTDLGLWSLLNIEENKITVKLVVQSLWIDEQKAAWFFAWVMTLFVVQEGNKLYTEEIAPMADDRLTIKLYNKSNNH